MAILSTLPASVTDVAGVGQVLASTNPAVASVTAFGSPIAVQGCVVTPHAVPNGPNHPSETVLGTTGASASVFIGGLPVAGVAETCSLGGIIGPGPATTIIVGA